MTINVDSGSAAFNQELAFTGEVVDTASLVGEFQADKARNLLADIINEENLSAMTDEQLKQAVDTLANLAWQRAVTVSDLATYLESTQKIVHGEGLLEVAASLGMSVKEFEAWTSTRAREISVLVEVDELIGAEPEHQTPKLELVASDVGALALEPAEIKVVTEEPQPEGLADAGPQLNPELIRRFFIKTYSEAEVEGLTDEQLIQAVLYLEKIASENPRHFQTGYKTPAMALHAERLILKLQGVKPRKIAEQQQTSLTSVNNSYRLISELVHRSLPLGVLLGEEEFVLKAPKPVAKRPKTTERKGSSYNNLATGVEIDKWRELASQGETVPDDYEGLFNIHEMKMLTVISRGIKPRHLSRVIVLSHDHTTAYRSTLLKKFGLRPKSSEVPKMIYRTVINKLVPIKVEFEPPSEELTENERLVFELKAQGLSDSQICQDPSIAELGLGLLQVRASIDSSRRKLEPGDGLPYGDTLLAVGHGIIPYQSGKNIAKFISGIRKIADDDGGDFERSRPLTIEEQTKGVLVPETRNGRTFMVRKLISRYDPEDGSGNKTSVDTINSEDIDPDQRSEIEELPAGF